MKRHNLDFYETDSRLTQTLLDVVGDINGRVFEPCVGDHAIARLFPSCMTADINPETSAHLHQDATLKKSWTPLHHEFDWAVTNPPFSVAHKIIPFALQAANTGIAFLLRLSWLEPTANRGNFLKVYNSLLSNLIIFNPRPHFRPDTNATDSVTVAWMVWRWDYDGTGTKITFADNWKEHHEMAA